MAKFVYGMKIFYSSFFFLVYFSLNFSFIEGCAIAFSFYVISQFIDKIGQDFCVVEIVKTVTVVTVLLVPELFYHCFTDQVELQNLIEEMPVSVEKYYGFVFPATFFFIFGLNIRFRTSLPPFFYFKLKDALSKKGHLSVYFICVGLLASILSSIVPSMLTFSFQIFKYLIYVGLMYAIFSDFKYKVLTIFICILISFFQVVTSGMYFEFLNFAVVITLILLTKLEFNKSKKYFIIIVGVGFLMFIQSIKTEYRIRTWNGDQRNGSTSVYLDIVSSRLTEPSIIFEPISLYAFTNRLNHGFIIAKVLDNVPSRADYGYGSYLLKSVFSTFVPRFIWQEKPKTGGAHNIIRYLGDKESADEKNSYNLGLIGEGYANFGIFFGCIYLFILGLFMKYIYFTCIKMLNFRPTLLLWYPMIFTSFFVMETDLLSFLNSFVKMSCVIALIFLFFKRVLKISL